MLVKGTVKPYFTLNDYNMSGCVCRYKAVLSISVSLSPKRHRSRLQLEAETAPGQEIYLRLLRCLSLSNVVSLQSDPPAFLYTTTNTRYWQHTRERHWSPTSWQEHLSRSLSFWIYPFPLSLPLFMLPSNQWTRACKQKSNRLHSWLFISVGNLWSHHVRGFGSWMESGEKNKQIPASFANFS